MATAEGRRAKSAELLGDYFDAAGRTIHSARSGAPDADGARKISIVVAKSLKRSHTCKQAKRGDTGGFSRLIKRGGNGAFGQARRATATASPNAARRRRATLVGRKAKATVWPGETPRPRPRQHDHYLDHASARLPRSRGPSRPRRSAPTSLAPTPRRAARQTGSSDMRHVTYVSRKAIREMRRVET